MIPFFPYIYRTSPEIRARQEQIKDRPMKTVSVPYDEFKELNDELEKYKAMERDNSCRLIARVDDEYRRFEFLTLGSDEATKQLIKEITVTYDDLNRQSNQISRLEDTIDRLKSRTLIERILNK